MPASAASPLLENRLVNSGFFTMEAVDDAGKPIPVNPCTPKSATAAPLPRCARRCAGRWASVWVGAVGWLGAGWEAKTTTGCVPILDTADR